MLRKSALKPRSKPLENKRHELFCQFYTDNKLGKIANSTQAYLYAFGGEVEIEKLEDDIEKENEEAKIFWSNKDRVNHTKSLELIESKRKRIKQILANARSSSCDLLAKPNISSRIDYLFDEYLNPQAMDREMAKVIAQDKDLDAKVSAYREVSKITGRMSDKVQGNIVVRWDDGTDKKPSKKVKTAVKAKVDESMSALEWDDGE